MDHVLLKRFTSPDETRPFEKGTFEVVLIPGVLDSTTNFIEHPGETCRTRERNGGHRLRVCHLCGIFHG